MTCFRCHQNGQIPRKTCCLYINASPTAQIFINFAPKTTLECCRAISHSIRIHCHSWTCFVVVWRWSFPFGSRNSLNFVDNIWAIMAAACLSVCVCTRVYLAGTFQIIASSILSALSRSSQMVLCAAYVYPIIKKPSKFAATDDMSTNKRRTYNKIVNYSWLAQLCNCNLRCEYTVTS